LKRPPDNPEEHGSYEESDSPDLYEQVAGEIRRAIADCEAKPGECTGTPERGAVLRARELVEFARELGYRVDELVEIIEGMA
jgi:hypothetical protein